MSETSKVYILADWDYDGGPLSVHRTAESAQVAAQSFIREERRHNGLHTWEHCEYGGRWTSSARRADGSSLFVGIEEWEVQS